VTMRVAYLVKRYPRFSETFIVNEILAHEEAGLDLEIFALRPPNDTHFQDAIARVRAPVRTLSHAGLKAATFWAGLTANQAILPQLHAGLADAWEDDVVDVHQAIQLARALCEGGISHLHAHFGTLPATVARLAARFAGISYSFTAHAKDLYHETVDREGLLRRHREHATIVAVSEFNRRVLIEECGFDPRQVRCVYNGLELDRYRYEAVASRPRRIIAIGRLVEKKGFADLIEACAILRNAKTRFECRIVGTGPLEQDLRNRIEGLGLTNHVHLTGPLPQEVTRRELVQSAIFAAPCVVCDDGDRDGVPTTILEAMALGVPCVTTDVTGIPEAVTHGRTGVVVPQYDPKALAEALGQLLDQPDRGVALSVEGRKLIEERFDARKNTRQLREIFAEQSERAGQIAGIAAAAS